MEEDGVDLRALWPNSPAEACFVGASIADGLAKPKDSGGLGLGAGPVVIVLAVAIVVLVGMLAATGSDVQQTVADKELHDA